MKGIFTFLLAVLIFSPDAKAERWILKNPSSPMAEAMAIRSFEFGGDRYVIVNAPLFSAAEASLRAVSESMVPDLKITLPHTDIQEELSNVSAWHVSRMQYGNLPGDKSGEGIVVAVLDTGVDYTHEALKDRMWMNTREIPGNGIDDDGNGYIDDVYGYNFEAGNGDPLDRDGHGTHCAGIIASKPESAELADAAQGVAPGVKIMAVRIIGAKQVGFLSDAVEGIKYAVDNGAHVLSNSWRVYRSWRNFDPSDENIELLRKAIEYAGEKGAVFVAAAGNERRNLDDVNGDPMFPGGYEGLDNLVVVAASNRTDQPAFFTNFGSNKVTVAAPGDSIRSTIPRNRWASMSGTSMAAPLVAGGIARGLSGAFSSRNAIDRLISTSKPSDAWSTRVRARGIVELVDYLKD